MRERNAARKFTEEMERFGREPRREGRLTKAIERQTAKVPSVAYLSLAMGSILAAIGFKVRKKDTVANFIGLWVPTILLMGLYNKIVKVEGSERGKF
jgi:hypothetical protein